MSLKTIHIGCSPLTDTVYAGYLNKDGQTWCDKVDVTNDFLAAVISRWAGYEQTIVGSNGKRYQVTVREVTKEAYEQVTTAKGSE